VYIKVYLLPKSITISKIYTKLAKYVKASALFKDINTRFLDYV
jgi:hypothetical protein